MDSRTEAFAACPDTGCDWGSFYLGWKASREALEVELPGVIKDHQITAMVNELTICAGMYAGSKQLRARIQGVVLESLADHRKAP